MNKTLYVSEQDAAIWDKARKYAGNGLSAWVTAQLKAFVESKEAQARGMERIVLSLKDGEAVRSKAFTGRWLILPDAPYVRHENECPAGYALALTAKDNVLVFRFAGLPDADGHYAQGKIEVFKDFAQAAETCPERFIAKARERAGLAVEELDI